MTISLGVIHALVAKDTGKKCTGVMVCYEHIKTTFYYIHMFTILVSMLQEWPLSNIQKLSDIPMISFSDVDECRFNVCEGSQTCINAPGSYKCSCSTTGYNKPGNCEGN